MCKLAHMVLHAHEIDLLVYHSLKYQDLQQMSIFTQSLGDQLTVAHQTFIKPSGFLDRWC